MDTPDVRSQSADATEPTGTSSSPIATRSAGSSESEPTGGEQAIIYWEREYSTALPPERLKLEFHPHRPLMSQMSLNEQRALASGGYRVMPDDCSAVRVVGQYGFLVRSPADIKIRRTADGVKWQSPSIQPEERLLGYKTYSGTYVDTILNSGYPKLCCGLRFYYPKHLAMMMKDVPNPFFHFPNRTFSIWEGIKTHEYATTPNIYDFLSGYEAFTANFLLQLIKPTVIKRGDPIGIVLPVLLPKQFALKELQHPSR
jgi:hypothetical protein